jgi:LysR family hydrogen peroxide-inducible transcriptional activator
MNFQQLQYILALAEEGQFVKAAEKCFVSQPTLSAMVRKLEEELGVLIFDRQSSPVKLTPIGAEIVNQAGVVLAEAERLNEIVRSSKNEVSGTLRVGIIPTVAPFLLPLFLRQFLADYPRLDLVLFEMTTRHILSRLEDDGLDVGILAIPVRRPGFREIALYEESFYIYNADPGTQADPEERLEPEDIDMEKLWLLEEGHCLRSQIVNLCNSRTGNCTFPNLTYEAGSIDSLKRIVDAYQGVTILPGLSTTQFEVKDLGKLRSFAPPVPARQIGLIVNRLFVKDAVLNALQTAIQVAVQPLLLKLQTGSLKKIIDPEI